MQFPFETVSINSIHAREFEITNTGVGTLVIGAINLIDC